MPDNLNEPSHRLMREVPRRGQSGQQTGGRRRATPSVAHASDYYSMLQPHCARVDVKRTTYHHPLAGGASGVVEWFKGSGLRPFL